MGKGKEQTKWDHYMFPDKGATGQEARNLDRSAPAESGSSEEVTDHHMSQFVPDQNVVGKSASKICRRLFNWTSYNLFIPCSH